MPEDARISTGFPRNHKTVKVLRRLQERGVLSLLWLFLWATDNRPDGLLAGLSDEDIEIVSDWKGDAGAFVPVLVDVGFLEGNEGERSIHQWAEHNPYVAARPERIRRSKEAAIARWNNTTNEQRSAAGKNAAAGRWKPSGKSEGKSGCVPDANGMHADSTHDACEPHVGCVPPTLPLPTARKEKTLPQTALAGFSVDFSPPVVDNKKSSPTDAQIEQLYKLYPRKRDKLDARKAIRKAVGVVIAGDPDHPAMTIEEALNYLAQRVTLYAQCVQGRDRDYIPYPASWFNAGSFWDDERDWCGKPGSDTRRPAAARAGFAATDYGAGLQANGDGSYRA